MRPFPEGKELVKKLKEAGISAWNFSLFNFKVSTSLISLSKKAYQLYTSDLIFVFSKKSIYFTQLYLNYHNLVWPSHPKYYAIGKNTAFFLKKYVLKKVYFPKKKKIVKVY
nr:uroporphyrinogen-III synthase [Buchnera aphidicola]